MAPHCHGYAFIGLCCCCSIMSVIQRGPVSPRGIYRQEEEAQDDWSNKQTHSQPTEAHRHRSYWKLLASKYQNAVCLLDFNANLVTNYKRHTVVCHLHQLTVCLQGQSLKTQRVEHYLSLKGNWFCSTKFNLKQT